MGLRRILAWLLIFALAAFVAAFSLHLLPMPSLAALRAHEDALAAYDAAHPLRSAAIFVAAYVAFAPSPLPAAELLAIAAGALFGVVEGIVLVSLAAAVGSCGAFLLGRFVVGDIIRRHLASRFAGVMRGIENKGAFYLFALHMIPAIPFFVINMAMGVTRLRLATFYWVTQLSVLPLIAAYVNAGRELGGLDSISGILSPEVLATLVASGLLPLAALRLAPILRRHILGGWALDACPGGGSQARGPLPAQRDLGQEPASSPSRAARGEFAPLERHGLACARPSRPNSLSNRVSNASGYATSGDHAHANRVRRDASVPAGSLWLPVEEAKRSAKTRTGAW